MPTEAEIAWAAGLFEGEGCINHRAAVRGTNRSLELETTDRDVVERFHDIVEHGTLNPQRRAKGSTKDSHRWTCSGWLRVKAVLELLRPWMGDRRASAADALLADPARPYQRT